MKTFFLLIVLFSSLTLAQSEPYHLKLLAVQETEDGYKGSDADLYLEIQEGSGRVFLETFPLTKLDTQISTRFAKDIACNHFKLNCNQYDFVYTIKAKSNIIGGPSAGAAVAALTTIAVLDLDYDKTVTITATVNSGGVIGPVGGVKEKLDAAKDINLNKVLIAKGTSLIDQGNETEKLNLIEYSKDNLSLEVIEVEDLDQVLLHLTGVELNNKVINVTENKEYTKIMQNLQQLLCGRNEKIESELEEENIEISEEALNKTTTRKASSINATLNEDYYSAASFCFSNNILLKNEYYTQKGLSNSSLSHLFRILERKVHSLEVKLDQQEISTISDLQTYMVVKERLSDVKQQIKKFTETQENGPSLLAYGEERFFSALSWMQFFSMTGKRFIFNNEILKDSCLEKISESEERYQYASLFLGEANLFRIKEKIDLAKESLAKEEFPLCLITASQAKADANAILSSIGVSKETFPEFLMGKKKAVERVIAENSAENIFPILGYSYYQYASSLEGSEDPYDSLVYLEYALEMSDLGMYFPEEFNQVEKFEFNSEYAYLLVGFILGLIVMWFVRK